MTHNITYYDLYKLDAISNFTANTYVPLFYKAIVPLQCIVFWGVNAIFVMHQYFFVHIANNNYFHIVVWNNMRDYLFNLINDYYVNIISMFCSCVKVFDWLGWTMWSMGPLYSIIYWVVYNGGSNTKNPHDTHMKTIIN
jgi:hypothetical protein